VWSAGPSTCATRTRKRRSARDRYDAVWCVFDVDTHDTLDAAIAEASRQSFQVAVSNPCFELWLLWHFENHFRSLTADALRRLLRPYRCADKIIPRDFPYSAYPDALRRSTRRDPVPPYSVPANPGTSVSALVTAVVRASG
jgi:RloB-like protein